MFYRKIKLFYVSLLVIAECCTSVLLLVRGNQWNLFRKSLSEYSFSTSFVDLCFFAYMRGGIVIGAVIGILWNFKDGPERCKKSMWIVTVISCINAYYACAKLLAFSEDDQFVAGPKLYWFWALFAFSIAGAVIFCYIWRSLASLTFEDTTSKVNCSLSEDLQNEGNKLPSETNKFKKPTYEQGSGAWFNHNRVTFKKLLAYAKPDWPFIVIALVFLCTASVTETHIPIYKSKVISDITIKRDTSSVLYNLCMMGVLSLFASLSVGGTEGVQKLIKQRLNIRLRNALFSATTKLGVELSNDVTPGQLNSRLNINTTTTSILLGSEINELLHCTTKILFSSISMFHLSWRLFIFSFATFPILVIASKFYGNYCKILQRRMHEEYAAANEVADDVFSSFETMHVFANEKNSMKQYKYFMSKVYRVAIRLSTSLATYKWLLEGNRLLSAIVAIWYGGRLVMLKFINPQEFLAYLMYQSIISWAFESFGRFYTGLMQALGAAARVFELIDRKPVISKDGGISDCKEFEGRISFRDVSLTYPLQPGKYALEDVSFDVKPGEVVALVGPSGGGKSSCVKLLQRFYDPDSGSVLLDGKPVCSYEHDFLHEKMTLVDEDLMLFARSIRENIVYGLDASQYTEQDITDACAKANAHDFIMELPDQYETELCAGGWLSSSLKQKLAVARALVRKPNVLLLDDATSVLDIHSENKILDAILSDRSHRSTLLISSRLNVTSRVDRIVVIVKGHVMEIGSHDELMEKRGFYYEMMSA